MAVGHEKVGHTGQGLWHHKDMQLPAYIQHIANDLMQQRGMSESQAVQMAVGICQRWAEGGGGVTPETRAKAAAAVAEWNALKAKSKASRSAMDTKTSMPCDADGLDASWDDLSGLPDLTGLDAADFAAADGGMGGMSRAARLGSGARFAKLKAALAAKGASDPGALAAHIGQKKYGKAKFTRLAAAARKRKGGGMSRSELMRDYPLEDLHIVRSGDGGDGRTMEAFAAVFNTETPIRDPQGDYLEVIEPAAFNKRLADLKRARQGVAQVKVLFNHGRDMEGAPAVRFQMPVAVPVSIEATSRGLLTRSRFVATALGEEVLELVKSGAVTAMSFTGRIIRSDPQLPRHGRYRADPSGRLTTVRRTELGLREFGPVLFPAYEGAGINGVRMFTPGTWEPDDVVYDDDFYDEALSLDGEAVTGGPPDVHPTRDHAHRLLVTRMEERCRAAGLVLPGRQ